MKIEVPMPKMGESIMEGTILKWHKKVGDAIRKDEILFEISTDKVDSEIPSAVDGIVTDIFADEGTTFEVGKIVAYIETGAVENSVAELPNKAEAPNDAFDEPLQRQTMAADIQVQKNGNDVKKETKRFYSPLVMSISNKENISFDEMETIAGSGLGGRVTKNDLLAYLKKRSEYPSGKIASNKITNRFVRDLVEPIPMDNIRQKIMSHMIKSRDTSVHVSATIEVDISKIYTFINKNKETYQRQYGAKLTYMAFVSHAVTQAINAYPVINSSIEGTTILQKRFVNLGIAVALEPNGLIVPNIKNSHEKSILELAKAISELAEKARTKKLSPDDVSNGTFSITNYGVFGTIIGTPIINQPEVAVLGVGAVIKKPVVIEVDGTDAIAIRPIMHLALSHDHRVVDGMIGGKFLSFVKEALEKFDEKNMI